MKAVKNFNLQGTHMTTKRTFTNEIDAVNQLIEWKDEQEAKGWVLKECVGNTMLMTITERNKTNFCKLYIIK